MKKVSEPDIEIVKLRFDYAWKWFSFHATQRTTEFNYFIIITGILAAAYVNLIIGKQYWLSAAICGLGVFCSIAFYALDVRNRALIQLAEDALCELEREAIFKAEVQSADGHKRCILIRDTIEADLHPSFVVSRVMKHRIWIRGIEIYIGIMFVCMAVGAFRLAVTSRESPRPAPVARSAVMKPQLAKPRPTSESRAISKN